MSETAASRELLAPFCVGLGMDVGFGGDPILPLINSQGCCLTFDMPRPYTSVGSEPQILRGDCRSFPFLCDGALDYLYSAHLLEDFSYQELSTVIIPEWRRVLRPGGLLVTNCPDQQRFLAHCARTGQGINCAHKEETFSFDTFQQFVMEPTGPWELIFCEPSHGAYSWLTVHRKV